MMQGAGAISAWDGIDLSPLLERLRTCASPANLRSWLFSAARALGFAGAHYIHLGHSLADPEDPGAGQPARFLSTREGEGGSASNWPGQQGIARRARNGFGALVWSVEQEAVSGAEAAWLTAERALGIAGGVAVPVQDYSAGPAFVNFFGSDLAWIAGLAKTRPAELAFLCVQFHAQAKRVLALSDRGHVQTALTSREIDCLRLAAMGRTVAETGKTLGITGRTVEFHLKNAAEKLGATSKVRAVALAVSRGLIHF